MRAYRFYFMDSDEHIKAVETIDCADDAAAGAKAADLLAQRIVFASVEVWREKDLVHRARAGS